MKIWKRIVTISAVMALTVFLFGCSQTTAPSSSDSEKEVVSPQTDEASTSESKENKENNNPPDAVVQKPEGYPSKNISWVVCAAAGAAIDIPTRALLDCIDLGANIMIENIAGASNVTGTLEVAKRAGDGYTILTTNSSGMVSQPGIYDTGYTPEDFRHIALLEPVSPFAVVVNPKSAINSVEDWISYVTNGDSFFYSVPNAGASSHLAIIACLEELGSTSGIYVPYNGTAEVSAAIQSGEIDFAVLGVSDNIIPQAEAGNMRIIVILNNETCIMAPDIPIISDYGVESCDCFYGFKYIAIKKDTPDEIAEWLKQEIYAGLASDKYKAYIEQAGLISLDIMSEEELTEIVYNAYETYSAMLKELGMTE